MDRVDRIIAQWAAVRPDLDTEPMALIGRMARIYTHLRSGMDETFARHGLNAAKFDVLATLRRSGAPYQLSPGVLLEATMVSSGTMTNRIDQLVKDGLVDRVPNPEDARSVLIALTSAGFEVIEAAVTAHVATQQRLLAGISAQDRAQLNQHFQRILADFE